MLGFGRELVGAWCAVPFCCSFVAVVVFDADKKVSTHGDELGCSEVRARTSVRCLEAW